MVCFLCTKNELEYKMQKGYTAFVDLLRKSKSKEIIDNKRKNLLTSKGFWDVFRR